MLQRPSQPTLLLLQYYPWMRSFGDGVTQGLYYREPETEMTVIGQYYDLPVVSVRAAAWRLMHEGIDGFKADKGAHSIGLNWGNKSIIPQAEAGEVDQYFYSDGLHPGPGGARVMAELMIHPLAVAVEEVAEGVQVEERQDPRLQGLPPPMIPHSPSIASSACYMLEEFKPLVKKAQGFLYRPERPARTSVLAQKWGWSGLQPGEWLQLEVSTMLEAASPQRNATVFLRAWEPPIPYTVFLNYPLHNVTQHPRCRLRVEIMNERPQQAEQKVMLAAMAVQLLN
ncbi:hypothetical protein C2E21_0336 [Chlorella sorokiniana]|uniref:Uncharacterized protein n=1 Tax=Chlorella sorokiniana TaxID=3076 RepID=A0A2P6U427_CHLSO|nr:hypothetical protein C2E21_0336 [Chlorella sorokiniana]|eukprot:PRW61062.1 hypothetical protein C2E21_0336 [Chlorella sorokiniana]